MKTCNTEQTSFLQYMLKVSKYFFIVWYRAEKVIKYMRKYRQQGGAGKG
jgi:hypothetical protein